MVQSQDQKTAVLKFVHQAQKTESLAHRQAIFNTVVVWSTSLMAIFGTTLALQSELSAVSPILRISAAVAVLMLSLMWIAFMARQRTFSNEALGIARNIESYLQLFEPGAYLPRCGVLPDRFTSRPRQFLWFTVSDWVQVLVLLVLTSFTLAAITLSWFHDPLSTR